MAAPIIKVKRSAVAGKIPTIAGLELGEFAINTYDGKVYIEQDQGGVGVGTTIVVVNPWSVGLGSTAYNTYFTVGSVGIGTTNPKAALNVIGVVSATSFVGDGSALHWYFCGWWKSMGYNISRYSYTICCWYWNH
jgi:hypothetical protein